MKAILFIAWFLWFGNARASLTFTPHNPVEVCGETVVYFVCPQDTFDNITWFFGDGEIAYGKSVMHEYTTKGKYTVKMLVSKGSFIDSVERIDFVTIKPVPQSKFRIDGTIAFGRTRRFINESIHNDSAFQNFSWAVNNMVVSSATDLEHEFDAGSYNISLTVINNSSCESVLEQTFQINDDDSIIPLAVTDAETENQIILYPNPVTDKLYIKHATGKNTYTIYDIHGKICLTGAGAEANVERLTEGLYVIVIQKDKMILKKRFYKTTV